MTFYEGIALAILFITILGIHTAYQNAIESKFVAELNAHLHSLDQLHNKYLSAAHKPIYKLLEFVLLELIENPGKVVLTKMLIAKAVYTQEPTSSFRTAYKSAMSQCDTEYREKLNRLHENLKSTIKIKIVSSSLPIFIFYHGYKHGMALLKRSGKIPLIREFMLIPASIRDNTIAIAETIAFKSPTCQKIYSTNLVRLSTKSEPRIWG